MASKLHEAVSFRTLPDVAAKCAKACFDERHFGFGFPAQLAAFEQEIRAVEVKLAKALFGDFNPDEPSHYVKDIIKEYNGKFVYALTLQRLGTYHPSLRFRPASRQSLQSLC